ncbi:spore gernimation protein GerA [Gordoniibacillus kamchatkensis]|uniref:Spore gernimation protein GerA n=1 Tax=Gordoniibacillus kamchatkensis TaxID=1590651 RepID=A0ABR5AJU8_9BACL|nr:spore germination protein [Paenibacillus sp. VKM B-2647]KIL40810.1 spore gernimation protein GerA [Paenibacillus sp. VKM B-2647]
MTKWEWSKLRSGKKKRAPQIEINRVPDQFTEQHGDKRITGDLEQTIAFVNGLLGDNGDFMQRRFDVFGAFPAVMFSFSNMSDTALVNTDILKPLMHVPAHLTGIQFDVHELKDVILRDTLYHGKASSDDRFAMIVESLLRGGTVIVVDGMDEAIMVETTKVEKRAIDQPETEQVIRGPREGFIEQLGTNLSLLRYRLPTTDLKIKSMKLGRVTKSRVAVCYLKGIVSDALVQEVENRLSVIDIDGVLDVGYLEQFIEDNNFSPFPQVQNTERTDKAVANLLEGRVVILVDGSPFALIVPTVFNQFYQTTEDYSERFVMVSFIRLARLLALAFSLITPSLYVAIIAFNPELIPTKFAVAVSGGRAGIPFPSVVEVLMMEASMEVLREATLRLPQQIGGALSIVGVLVVGQAAVSAGFVSPITVVVIALTTIGSFATPAYNAALALRLLRFPLVILAAMFGLYGVMVGLILIANHLLSLRSFGVPYLSPVVPGNFDSMKDTVARAPLWSMKKRPAMLHTPNDDRVGGSVMDELKEPPHNTLDPLKVGNHKEEMKIGISSSNNGDTGGSDSH